MSNGPTPSRPWPTVLHHPDHPGPITPPAHTRPSAAFRATGLRAVGYMISPLPKSRAPAESTCTTAGDQSLCVTSAHQRRRKDGRSWNEQFVPRVTWRGLRLTRSARVRRQGLEPRTRGLRVDCWAAPYALPARTSQESAPNARNAQAATGTRSTKAFHGIHAGPRRLVTECSQDHPPPGGGKAAHASSAAGLVRADHRSGSPRQRFECV